MDNSTIVKIHGSKGLFKSIAKELMLEADGKSHAQKMTEKMMKPSGKGGSKATAADDEIATRELASNEGVKKPTNKVANFETDTEDTGINPAHKKETTIAIKKLAKMLADRWGMDDTEDAMKVIKSVVKKTATDKKSEEELDDKKESNKGRYGDSKSTTIEKGEEKT